MAACESDPSIVSTPHLHYITSVWKKQGEKSKEQSQRMLNEVEELYAILNTVLLYACLKWQQRQEVQRILYFTF